MRENVPKVLINPENSGQEASGLDFADKTNCKLFIKGNCDDLVRQIVEECGWTTQFEAILPDIHKQFSTPLPEDMMQDDYDEE